MKRLPMLLALPFAAFAGGAVDASNLIQEVSYWGYVLLPLVLLVAFVYHGWFSRPKER